MSTASRAGLPRPLDTASALSVVELAVGVFVLSFGVLLTEISFTRVFSYAISYHFAYLTVATALLGFGSAGSVLAAFPGFLGDARTRLVSSSAVAGIAVAGTLAYSSFARFDPRAVGHDPAAMAGLALYYVVVAVPFFCAGVAVCTVLSERPRQIARLYGADLAGAALGCAASVPLIWLLGTPAVVVVGAAAIAASGITYARGSRRLASIAVAGVTISVLVGIAAAMLGPFPPSPDKFLSAFLRDPDAIHLFERWTPISRVDVVGWRRTETSWKGSYNVVGVGDRFEGRGPEFRMVGYDGGSFAVMYEWNGDSTSLDMFRHHLMALPYQTLAAPRTAIIGLGGGADALAALANGAGRITGIELNPVTVELGRERFKGFNGGLFVSPRLDVVTDEARHWMDASDDRFDLIVLNGIDTLSALSTGAYVLAESYLYTVDAFTTYLEHLTPAGMYALYSFDNFGVAGPTMIVLRFTATLEAALRNLGVASPEQNLVVIATRGTTPLVAMLAKRTPFSAPELDALTRYADAEGFSFWYRPDRLVDHQVARFLRMSAEERSTFIANHYLRFDPATDDSPFFFNFYKWDAVVKRRADDAGTTPATGQRMLLVMLVQAVVFSVVMILAPLQRLRSRARVRKPLRMIVYFAALGLGFILLEIAILQRFVLFLGNPTYSLSIVLFSLLVFTGMGSLLSGVGDAPARRKLTSAAVALVILVAAFELGAHRVFGAFLGASLPLRIGLTMMMLAPFGLVLGFFFPLGIRRIEAIDRELVPWAWAINGCSTVVGTVAAVMLAMAYGFDVVAFVALAIYLVGVGALHSLGSPEATPSA